MYQILPASLAVYCTSKSLVYIQKGYFVFSYCKKYPRHFLTASLFCTDCVPSPEAGTPSHQMISQYYAETVVCYWTEGRVPNIESSVLLSLAPGIFLGKVPTNYYADQNLLTLWDLTRSQPEETQMVRHSHHYQHPQANELYFV